MINSLGDLFSSFSPEMATIFLALLPFTELRAALPLSITVFYLNPFSAYFFSVIGNVIPVFFILWGLPSLLLFAEKHSPQLQHFFEKHVYSLEKKHEKKYQRYGRFVLFVFTAIPLSVSGVWTASILAVLFHIERKYAFIAITLGMLTAGLIVLLIVTGVL